MSRVSRVQLRVADLHKRLPDLDEGLQPRPFSALRRLLLGVLGTVFPMGKSKSSRGDKTPKGPAGAAQGKNWLGGPVEDELRDDASKRARSVVDGECRDDAEGPASDRKSDADVAKERERQMERDGTELPG